MRKFILLVAVLLLGGFALGAGPASATDQSEAVKICAKNPNCGMTRGNGGVNLYIEGSSGGGGYNAEVWCPDQGECTCLLCPRVGPKTLSVLGTIQLGTKRLDLSDASPAASDSGGRSSPSGAGTGHIDNGNPGGWSSGDIGQWHATTGGSGGTPGQIN